MKLSLARRNGVTGVAHNTHLVNCNSSPGCCKWLSSNFLITPKIYLPGTALSLAFCIPSVQFKAYDMANRKLTKDIVFVILLWLFVAALIYLVIVKFKFLIN